MSQDPKTTPARTAAKVAKLRSGGAKWDEVREKTGSPWTDTKFRNLLRASGYAPSGVKGGDGLKIGERPAKKSEAK